jgi:hypothetical protein
MFQNGLMATFIPEIIMVIAYIYCLFVPNINVDNSAVELSIEIVQVTTLEQTTESTYRVLNFDTQYTQQAIPVEPLPNVCPVNEVTSPYSELLFEISDGLSFVQFSRPPPFFLS